MLPLPSPSIKRDSKQSFATLANILTSQVQNRDSLVLPRPLLPVKRGARVTTNPSNQCIPEKSITFGYDKFTVSVDKNTKYRLSFSPARRAPWM